jgi:hypothetical protein
VDLERVHSASWGQLRSYLEETVAAPAKKTETNDREDPLRWTRNTLYPQKYARGPKPRSFFFMIHFLTLHRICSQDSSDPKCPFYLWSKWGGYQFIRAHPTTFFLIFCHLPFRFSGKENSTSSHIIAGLDF